MCCAQAGGDGGGGGGDPLVAGNGGRQEEVVEQCLPGGRDTWERGKAEIASQSESPRRSELGSALGPC